MTMHLVRTPPAGLTTPCCGTAAFRATEHQLAAGAPAVQLYCGRCAAPVRLLAEYDYRPAGPVDNPADQELPEGGWIGLVRSPDGAWLPVALAETPARCWAALALFPWRLDMLVIPTERTPLAKGGR